METLSDSVFSIVITLLALDIRLPKNLEVTTELDLVASLYLLLPSIAAYILSFLIIGIFWNAHHTIFTLIRIVDRKLLWMNIFYLMLVAFIPFPTSLLAQHPNMITPIVFYSFTLTVAGLWQLVILRYVDRQNHLSEDWYEHSHLKHAVRISLVGPALYILSIALAFVRVQVSFVLLMCVPIYYIFIANSEKHLPQE